MNKRLLTFLPVLLVVFLCSQFPVYAVTGGGKTIVSNSYSYNNGDVTVYVKVNGIAAEELYEGQHYYPHNFTVTLANNTNEFQIADANNFSVDLYSGSATAFASNQNAWGAEITSYSDNMTVPRITMYPSGDLAGHVIIGFNDSDLLVLNPNETRTYNFSINFIQTENINYTPLNGNYRYSYFTYTGTVGFYARPTSFTGNTIEDFINNDSLPNSVIAYFQQLIQNAIYNDIPVTGIISALNTSFNSKYIYSSSNTAIVGYRNIFTPYIYARDVEIDPALDDNYLHNDLYILPVDYYIITRSDKTYYTNSYYFDINFGQAVTGYYSYNIELDDNDYWSAYIPNTSTDSTIKLTLQSKGQTAYNRSVIPQGTTLIHFRVNYFYLSSDISNIDTFVSSNAVTFNPTISNLTSITVSSESFFSSFQKGLGAIYDRLVEIINSYVSNQQNASDLDDDSNNINGELDNVHSQEQQWYSDNEAAIQATGLSNYQFSSSQISGLTAIRTQFSDIWDALDDWNLIYIFTLLLSFATFILRHRPTTKAQQRYKEQASNRSLQREYYTSRMNDSGSGQGDLMQMALRKYR